MQGLIDSVQKAIDALNATHAWKARLVVNGDGVISKKETEVILFRMIQELMNNAVKHSQGDEFSVTMQFGEKELAIVCADNGKGMPAETTQSIGFTSLRNRISLLKGSISFGAHSPSGLQVSITVPKSSIL